MKARWLLALAGFALLAGGCHPSSPPVGRRAPDRVAASASPGAAAGGVVLPVATQDVRAIGTVHGSVALPRTGVSAVIDVRDVDGDLVARVHTDRTGGFSLNLPTGSYTMSSRVQGDVHETRQTIQVMSGSDQTLRLQRPPRG